MRLLLLATLRERRFHSGTVLLDPQHVAGQ
jgi:hypothetical protein